MLRCLYPMGNKLYPLSCDQRFKSHFFAADESNLNEPIKKIRLFHDALEHKNDNLGKRPTEIFRYNDIVSPDFFTKRGRTPLQVTNEIKQIFDGAIKWHSPKTAFNITSTPLLETVAASTLITFVQQDYPYTDLTNVLCYDMELL